MIEELCEYLVRHGYSEKRANEIHDVCYDAKEDTLLENERKDVLNWKREVGEVPDMYMEDVATISLDAMKVIEDGLKKFGVVLTDKQEDEFFVPIRDRLETLSNGDYRSQN